MGYSTWTLQTDTTVDEYLRQTFGPGIEAYELVGAEIYAAARFEDDRTVFAVVILPHQAPCTRPNGEKFYPRGSTIADQSFGEDMGPYYYNCPRRIFEMLTPLSEWTTNPCWAPKWRTAVAERLALREDHTA